MIKHLKQDSLKFESENRRRVMAGHRPQTYEGGRTNDYFLAGDDISREVITADICGYVGPDALVRPYRHHDVSSSTSFDLVMLSLK